MTIEKEIKLVNTLKENSKLREIVKRLQILHNDKSINIMEVIHAMNLPINYHLYITANYSDLMQIKIKP